MWLKIAWMAGCEIAKGLLGSWLSRWRKQKELKDVSEPYKKEIAIKNKPVGTDDDIIGRL